MSDLPNGNGNGVPEWMRALGLEKSEWLRLSKPQLRVMQRPDKLLKTQVWATGMLHSPGYNGEEATTKRNERLVPLRPGDIRVELHRAAVKYYKDAGIKPTDAQAAALLEDKENIRAALKELEAEGVCQRTDEAGTPLQQLPAARLKRLPSGKTRMFFWLIPRSPSPDTVKREWLRRQSPPDTTSRHDVEVVKSSLPIPPIWKILNVLQIEKPEKPIWAAQIADPEYQKRVERGWQAARKVFMEVVAESLPQIVPVSLPEVVVPAGALERKGKKKEEASGSTPRSSDPVSISPRSSSSAVSSTAPPKKAEEEDRRSPYRIFKDEYPGGHFDEPKTKPAFEKKTKLEQRAVIERLRVYLESDRWTAEEGRWIPLSSTWLKTCEADPPPALKMATAAVNGTAGKKSFKEDVMEEAAARIEKWGRL